MSWQPIATAPKTRTNEDRITQAIYLLGYCPVDDAVDLTSCVCVVWWEPFMKEGRGMWYGEGGYELNPTHWMPLPEPPQ